MAETHDIGRIFTHIIELAEGTPLVHRAVTNEIDWPYRRARPLVVRLRRTEEHPELRGLVIGWWIETGRTEEEALIAALEARTSETVLDEEGHIKADYEVGDVDEF